MSKARGFGGLGSLALAVLVLSVVPLVRAGSAAAAPPGYLAGAGQLEGTELVQDEAFTGALCLQATKTIFGLRGAGTYHGQTASGQAVVYKGEIAGNETLYGNGPVRLEVESTQTYYHGPFGTHGTSDASCGPATAGSPVPAEFRYFAPDHVYRLDGTGAQGPCRGQGTFARGGDTNDTAKWQAEWTLSQDCTVIGNAAGTPGTGVAPAGTAQTHAGSHNPCFNAPCQDNLKFDYTQYLPLKGFHVTLSGPASATIGSPVAVSAAVTNDGQPVPSAAVNFSVTGPSSGAPPAGAGITGADGRASFTFTAAVSGTYTVAATARTTTQSSTSSPLTVTFTPTAPPAMVLTGPANAQTEEGVTATATFSNAGNPVPGATVSFAVTGAGATTPASGSALTDQNGKASFTFSGARSGDYTVTASAAVAGQSASATHSIHLEINTFYRLGSVSMASGETSLHAAVIEPTGRYAYFGTTGSKVIKVDVSTLQRVGVVTSVGGFTSAVIDPAGRYAYFGTGPFGSAAPQVVRIDLGTFQQAGVVTLSAVAGQLQSAVIDPAGRYAYFGTSNNTALGQVAKLDLDTFQQVDALTFEAGETELSAAVMDPAGRFAYFGARGEGSTPGRVVKVDLSTFRRVGAVILSGTAENRLLSAVIDPAGDYAYFGTGAAPGRVVRINLQTLARVDAITMASKENYLATAVIDPIGRAAYFGAEGPSASDAATVIKVDLSTFRRTFVVTLPVEEHGLRSAVMDPGGHFAYIGTDGPRSQTGEFLPGQVVKMAIARPPKAALAAAADTYSTPYASPLTVAAPGVLANDVDTGDGDPLTAQLDKSPAHGSVNLTADGSFTYTPASDFSGTDTFTYTASDAMDYSAPATVSVAVAAPAEGVSSVSGGAFGFSTTVSLFGGPAEQRGPRPAVTLAPSGGDLSASDPDGDVGQYGPAFIFENHGALTVHTLGTTGTAGAVQSSASVKDIADNDPFHAGGPDGEASSTCSASQSVLGGSARIVNGRLVTSTHPSTGDPVTEVTFSHDWAPAPNTEYRGTLNHVGDSWRMVFNEQVLSPGAITVNAVHLYLLGPTAVGDMVIGSSRCGVVTSAANAAPIGNDDAYTATAGRPLVVAAAGVLANDTDADGQALTAAKPAAIRPPASGGGTWTFPGEPAHGSLDLRADGSFTYTPARGYSGPDSFSYLAQDSRGKSDPATVSLTVNPAPTQRATADFDGNGSTDVSVFRPGTGTWYLQGRAQQNYGVSGDIAVPADYDGDGKADVAVFRPSNGVWYLHGSAGADTAVAFGASGDVPVPADYDGDAKADLAVFRNGVWYVHGSAGVDSAVAFGAAGDIAVPADYDGDAKADRAVFRAGVWYVKGSAGVDTATAFGTSGDVAVPGDYDGNGTAEMAVFRPANGVWFVQSGATTAWGTSGDVPVPGDYDGDADLEPAVFRPSNGVWFVQGAATTAWGASGDVPLPLPGAVYGSMG